MPKPSAAWGVHVFLSIYQARADVQYTQRNTSIISISLSIKLEDEYLQSFCSAERMRSLMLIHCMCEDATHAAQNCPLGAPAP
jgi:hypothetical protein